MMSSLATSTYPRIDHRTVLKNLQIETNTKDNNSANNNTCKDIIITDVVVFNPISKTIDNNKTTAPADTKLSKHTSLLPLPISSCSSTRTYILPRSNNLATLAPKTKIPYPLATLWSPTNHQQKHYNFKRSSSVRLRGTKSNLPLIMEPTINETTTTTNACTVNEEKCSNNNSNTSKNTHETTTTAIATGGLQFSTRRKLALISQTDANVAEPTLIKRSLSLRRNFKVSTNNNNINNNNNSSWNNKTDSSKDKICVAANIKSSSLHDVAKTKDQGDGLKTSSKSTLTTSTTTPTPTTATGVDKQTSTSTAVENVKDLSKMSLNHNGVTAHIDTSAATTTTTTAVAANASATSTVTQQTRPLTLTTTTTVSSSSSAAAAGISKGLKSPKSPHTGNHIITTSTPITGTHSHCQHNHTSSSLCKTSPGSKLTPKTPPVTPDSPTTYLDDDLDSLFSYGTTTSGRSTMSCEHPYVARNGTTFSGRKMKYVVHCSNYAGQVGADYLTPTQRAQRQLRRLKELLCAARQDLEQKDSEILRLTREVVELRLFKASLSSPEERSASSDAVTVREAELKTSQDVSPIVDMVDDAQKTSSPRHHAHTPSVMLHQQHLPQSSLHHQHQNMLHLSSDMQSSFADSGHFEDMTSSSVHSKDSSSYTPSLHTHDQACGSEAASCSPNASAASAATVEQYELQRQELIRLYEQRIEDLIRNQDAATSEMKRTNCDRIEALLQKLAECNTRYADIVPDYEHAKERIRELEKQLEELQRRLAEHEEKQKQMYLHMYQKGQESERIARADQALELAHRAPQNKVSINELLHQLQSTQDELENIRAAECRNECGNNHALLTAKEAISLWVLGARKTIYRRLLEAQKNRTHVDPEVTLQFLKSAVYYFLTDKENSQGHLQAIESILEFSEAEKQTINKARFSK
ncbi:protein quick-to-court isoform X1 [Lucilia cuprina]|uniref:protein quick-to-court isoform X1 n=1 Tax=Lucilia cuprina TaxID=7375 RepID=UPI001F05B274|nr:protein quick-to-court isoform X1 [Lucilia cuprina]XP_046801962.1 protein quick-to-court isoform X1 [Lucilia cuprina]